MAFYRGKVETMRILFIHEVNYLEKPIFEIHEFPEHLARRGHEVAFVHFPEGWSKEQVKAQGFKKRIKGRAVKDSTLSIYTPQNTNGGFLGRLKTAISFGETIRKILDDFEPDIVVSFAVPTSGWQALMQSKKRGIPFVFRALDVSHKIRKSIFSGLIKSAEKFIYMNSDHVSANNPAMAEYCISLGAKTETTSVDLPPLDLSHFANADSRREEIRASLGIPEDAKVIVYMGSFFYFSGLPDLIRDFATTELKNTYLVLIGGGDQDQELRSLVKDLSIQDKVLFTGFIGFAELPDYLGIADVAVNPMLPSLVSNTAFPNKVIQYMASGLPVASTNLKGLEMTFKNEYGVRFSKTPSGVSVLAIELLESQGLHELGAENRKRVSRLFSNETAVTNFESVLKSKVRSNA